MKKIILALLILSFNINLADSLEGSKVSNSRIKMLNGKYGASIDTKSLPSKSEIKKILNKNSSIIKLNDILSWGDDYELIFTSFKKNRKKLINFSKKYKFKISLVGYIIEKPGIFNDSMKRIKNISSFDHFS